MNEINLCNEHNHSHIFSIKSFPMMKHNIKKNIPKKKEEENKWVKLFVDKLR